MALKHFSLDLPMSKSVDLGEGRLIYRSFKKDKHAKLLLKNLAVMQANDGMLTDLAVRTKSMDHEEPFHSMLLAACSPVIKRSLTGKHFDCTAGVISLADLTPRLLEAFRDSLYKSELPLEEGLVDGLRRFANRYEIAFLEQLCGQRRDQREGDEGMAVWSKHHEDVLSLLHDMFQKTELTTTVFEDSEGGTQFAVHGPLLAAASPVFRDMLSNDLFAQERAKYRLKEVTCNALGDLIEFVYTGEVTLEKGNVADLLHAACSYEIPALAKACCNWLGLQLDSCNAIGIWWLTREENCEYTSDLEEDAKGYIVANFTSVCEEDEFSELEYEDLKEIIQDDNLCVQGEDVVFSAVVNWVEMDEDGRSSLFCDLLQCVRLVHTSLEFLRNVEREPLVANCTRCLLTVREAQEKLSMAQRASDTVEQSDIQRGYIPEVVPPRFGDDEDVKRMLLHEFLESQSRMPTSKTPLDSDDGLKEMTKQIPRKGPRKSGEPDMRLSINRRKLGSRKIDGSPDMRFKVNKEALGQKGVPAAKIVESPLKRDGTPDMRFKVNKNATGRSSSQKSTKTPQRESEPSCGPVKNDGTPDMRYAVNKSPTVKTSSSGIASTPVKRDGTPDMRYAVNKQSASSSPSGSRGASLMSQLSSHNTPNGPLKNDGTPDMRYAVNKSASDSPLSSGYSSGGSAFRPLASGSVNGSGSHGPLKSDGTPDRRYAANKSSYGSSSSYGGSSSSSSLSRSSGGSYGGSSSCGPLKSNGTPDMRYAANKSSYGSSSSYGGSSSSSSSSRSSGSGYGGSSSCGPLKSNGTPDMRFSANRR